MAAKRLIVVGASGSLGGLLAREARAAQRDLIATARRIQTGFTRFDAQIDDLREIVPSLGANDCVYLAYGLADPSWVCTHAAEARAINVDTTIRALDTALGRGARTVFFSSELVFDGRTGGYDELSVPNPITEYGRQKVEVERYLLSRHGNWVIVRIGSTVTEGVGENCVVEKTYSTLLSPNARMAPDNLFSLTSARTTAQALLALAEHGERGVYHLVAEPPVSRTQLASWIVSDSRFATRMEFTESPYRKIPFPEPRPTRSYMIGPNTYPRLGVRFSSARDAIRNKVALLDARLTSELERTVQ